MNTVVFDLGGVLVDWDPRYLLRKVMPGREAEMETILADVLNHEWNFERDRGHTWAAAMAEAKARYPQWADIFDTYTERWAETIGGSHEGSVEMLRELKQALDTDYASWQRLGERAALYQSQLLRESAANAQASLNAYQSGVTEFTTLMRARITDLNVRLDELRVRVDRAMAQASLLYLAGEDQ